MFASKDALKRLTAAGQVRPASVTDVASAGIGIGLHAGTAPPPQSTTVEFIDALRAARAVAYIDPPRRLQRHLPERPVPAPADRRHGSGQGGAGAGWLGGPTGGGRHRAAAGQRDPAGTGRGAGGLPRLCSSPSFFHPSTNRRMYRLASSGEMGEPCGMPRR